MKNNPTLGGITLFFALLLALVLPPKSSSGQGSASVSPESPERSSFISHQLTLCQSGTVMGWGSNNLNQLQGNASYVATPVVLSVPNTVGIAKVVTVPTGSFAILRDGSLLAWGSNANGRLGLGTGITQTAVPMVVGSTVFGPSLAQVVDVSGGIYCTYALCRDGSVWSWGDNQDGGLGDNSPYSTIRYLPQQIPFSRLSNVQAIAAGDQFCLALTTTGSIYSWGRDIYGELGIGLPVSFPTGTQVPTPTQVSSLSNIIALDATNTRSGAVRNDGAVFVWGANGSGELGLGHSNPVVVPTRLGQGLFTGVAYVSMGLYARFAVCGDGRTYVWGSNYTGSFGMTAPAQALTPIAGPTFTPACCWTAVIIPC